MFVELVLFIFLVLLLRSYIFKSRDEQLYSKLPGPKPYPLIGNILEFYFPKKDIPETVKRLSFQYGPIYLLRLGAEKFVCLRHPEDIETVLSNSKIINKAPLYDLLKPWMGDGLFTCSGAQWTKQRKIISPAFSLSVLETFIPTFEKNAQIFVKNLLKKRGKDFDVMPIASPCSLDIICETAMGLQVNAQLGESTYLQAIEELSEIVCHRGTTLIERSFLFPYMKAGRRHDELLAYIHAISEKMVQEKKGKDSHSVENSPLNENDDDIGIKKKRPFLDLLLEYNKEGAGMTDLDIRKQVDTFITAGYDTVQSTISFALYSLSQNQDIQDRVLDEMKQIFGESQRDATFQDLHEMKYLERVLKETLRLYPAAQFLARMTYEDLKLTSGFIIPKNSSIMILIEAMNIDPKVYVDPLKFNPDRFDSKKTHPYAFLPFGAGIRNCIGQKYAMLELKSVVSRVVRSMRLLPSSIPLDLVYELVLRSKTGINLRVEPRSRQM